MLSRTCPRPRKWKGPESITSTTPCFGEVATEPSDPVGKGNTLNTVETISHHGRSLLLESFCVWQALGNGYEN